MQLIHEDPHEIYPKSAQWDSKQLSPRGQRLLSIQFEKRKDEVVEDLVKKKKPMTSIQENEDSPSCSQGTS